MNDHKFLKRYRKECLKNSHVVYCGKQLNKNSFRLINRTSDKNMHMIWWCDSLLLLLLLGMSVQCWASLVTNATRDKRTILEIPNLWQLNGNIMSIE